MRQFEEIDPPARELCVKAPRTKARPLFAKILVCAGVCVLLSASALSAQNPLPTGPQQLAFTGLRSVAFQGQFNAVQTDAQGNLYLLLDQKDGVRVLKTDPTATNVLAQAQFGAKGDIGLALSLDPTGNVYVTGTTTSGAMIPTPGAAFSALNGSATNSFVAKFDVNLNPVFVTFTGGALMAATSIAATADAVFITGSIFSATLPVTPAAILQTPAYNSASNGFVEKFSASGTSLLYATYLTGANGSTTPVAIAADSADNAYIAGTTTSPGYPTIAALVPEALGAPSGFLTKLTPAGDGIIFSTYIPGGGISSLALDTASGNLLLSGPVSLGQFPVQTVSAPLTATAYQVLLRMPLDGSAVLASTVLAPGPQSYVAAGPSDTAWVDGGLSLPLLPLTPLSPIGNSFAVRVNAAGIVDQTVRFGGIAASNPGNAGAPVALTSIAVDPTGNAIAAGSFAPYASQGLLPTETFDLPLTNAPTAAFPSTVRSAVLPASACNGSLCAGSAAYLAQLTIPATAAATVPSLALSVDDSPNLTLRNLGSAAATGLQITAPGFTLATNCAAALASGDECSIALSGSGPGSITASATNAATQTASLPALPPGTTPLPIVFSPKETDFGIVSAASGTATRTITVTNLSHQSQTFASALGLGAKTTLPSTIAETASDCTLAGIGIKLLAPGSTCHITLGLTPSMASSDDGAIQQNWKIGTRDVALTAFGQAAALSLSAQEIDFGTQYAGGLRTSRYLYLSNNSTTTIPHAAVTLPAASPFSVADGCPELLEPLTVCQLRFAYQNAHTPSADSVTLSLDQGLTVLVTGRSLPQPGTNGGGVNPNLGLSATSLSFAAPVAVTGISSNTQTLTLNNTGSAPFSLALVLTGDFIQTTNCGATLTGGDSCNVVLTFAPSQPGTRQGMLSLTAGAGTTPVYVALSGVGKPILSPSNNGTLDFGGVIVGEPSVQWYKVTQPFPTFAVTAASTTLGTPFTATLVEDSGYGHGQPPASAFTTNPSGTCLNCWLGVRFTPAATGPETGTLTLTSSPGGSPYILSLTGNGLPLTGLLLTPATQDFGPVPIHSTSGSALFQVTNLVASGGPVTVASPTLTGDFILQSSPTGGAPCNGPLAYTASCLIEVAFTPTATGQRTGALTVQAASTTATAALTGYGSADPGVSLAPTALTFNNVPGATATQQTIAVTNTSSVAEQIGAPTLSNPTTFAASSNCGTLAPAATCSLTVTFTPSGASSSGVLQIPVTAAIGGAPILTTYTVTLTGAYTTQDAGLQIVPAQNQYGPQSTGSIGITRQFTINNLTAKSVALALSLPRQFILAGAPCSNLAAYASCNFSVAFLPLTNGDITGTLFAQATPTDGSTTLNGIAYVEGYGIASGALSIAGNLMPGGVLNFGQVPSGKSATQALTLTNTSSTSPLNIRRMTSGWPFLSATTCGTPLAPGQSCTVTLTYAPVNQVPAGSSPPPTASDSGTLVLESDAASGPDLINLSGASTPAFVASPSNTPSVAALAASQNSLTFANTQAGSISAPQTLTLNNTGTAPLTVSSIQTTPDFAVTHNCSTVLPGASCTLNVTFTPQASSQPGSDIRAAAIEISSNATTSLEFISLAGVSRATSFTLSQTSLNFGTVLVGANTTLTEQVTNTGPLAATFTALTTTGDYSATSGSCPASGATLAAYATCALQVTFAPTQSGTRTGTLSLATSATAQPLTVPLTGIGVQSHLQISPTSLSFAPTLVGSSASLSLTLANTGTAPINGIALAITGDYAITIPCAVTTLDVGESCSVTLTFTPTTAGPRSGTLTVTSSDATSPAAVPLTGSGIVNGFFTLTASGATTASATVQSGSPAAYTLTLTPVNSFTGAVALNCTPILPAQYADCSLQPSSVTLSSSSQTVVATLTTVTTIASASTPPGKRPHHFSDTALCLLFPALFFTWKARISRHNTRRSVGPVAWAIFAAITLLTSGGCGGNKVIPSNLRYTPAGTYQYQVTASGVSAGVNITQTVTLSLTVQ